MGGTSYGEDMTFRTTQPPVAITNDATSILNNGAVLNGSVNANDLETAITFEYGTSSAYGASVSASPGTLTGNISTSVAATLSGLTAGVQYHFRVKAVSAAGTSYGSDHVFTTLQAPSATTAPASQVANTTATLNGTVSANGSTTTVTFDYGLTTSYGFTATASQSPVTGQAAAVSSAIAGLTPGETYHYRVVATSPGGTTNGNDQTFTTTQPPVAVTDAATSIGPVTATLNATVNAKGLSTVVTFEYGTTTSYGQIATVSVSPVTGSTNTSISTTITSLSTSTTYHYRVKAFSNGGTVYGGDVSFTTAYAVMDYDGNIYPAIMIGEQEWIKINLKTTSYSNGDPIGIVTDNALWASTSSGAYSWYNNNSIYSSEYGGLYNMYAVQDVRNICPSGWHVPTKVELGVLSANSENGSCGLKETGTSHWIAADPCATNSTGFTALPGGVRGYTGGFSGLGEAFHTWTSTIDATGNWYMGISGTLGIGFTITNNHSGMSIRCIKGALPLVLTDPATAVTSLSATLNGKVNPNTAATTVTFEYGTTTSYGNEIAASQSPVSGNLALDVSSSLTGLTANTTYHFRVKAVNSGGTSYGSDMTFTTLPVTVVDIDGNTYNTVQIGTQIWMQENLRTSKFNDGSTIPFIVFASQWSSLYTPAIGTINTDTYGFLYNWYSVETGKLCPTGWHVPTDVEWTTLTTFLGGESVAGGKLKETGTSLWLSPNTGATNQTGFTGLPGGERHASGVYSEIGYYGFWWSSTVYDAASSWDRCLIYNDSKILRNYSGKQEGLSVRCIKD